MMCINRSGRKKAALAYVLTYTVGCVTKHFNNFSILLVGRLFCGVATSLLNSAFESWLVAEHSKVRRRMHLDAGPAMQGRPHSMWQHLSWVSRMQRNYNEDWLGSTFSAAIFVGNGLVAILCGLVAHTLVEALGLGAVAPFDAAHAVLLLGGLVVLATWTENYGDDGREQRSSFWGQIWQAVRAIRKGASLGSVAPVPLCF